MLINTNELRQRRMKEIGPTLPRPIGPSTPMKRIIAEGLHGKDVDYIPGFDDGEGEREVVREQD